MSSAGVPASVTSVISGQASPLSCLLLASCAFTSAVSASRASCSFTACIRKRQYAAFHTSPASKQASKQDNMLISVMAVTVQRSCSIQVSATAQHGGSATSQLVQVECRHVCESGSSARAQEAGGVGRVGCARGTEEQVMERSHLWGFGKTLISVQHFLLPLVLQTPHANLRLLLCDRD